MSNNAPSAAAPSDTQHPEKATASSAAPPVSQVATPKKGGLFSRKKKVEDEKTVDSSSDGEDTPAKGGKASLIPIDPATGKPYAPVGFFQLFRYSTPFEIFIDIIGLVCAAASGSAQVSLSPNPRAIPRSKANLVTFGSR